MHFDSPESEKAMQPIVKQIKALKVEFSTTCVLKGREYLNDNEVDLIITDIKMPVMNGIDLIQSLKKKPLVILCTNFKEEYALKGHEVSPIAYIEKPVTYAKLILAVDRAYDLLNPKIIVERDHCFVFEVGSPKDKRRIDFEKIIYTESVKNNVKVHTPDGFKIVRNTMTEFLKKLPPKDFMKISRSIIIRLDSVINYKSNGTVYLKGVDKFLSVSPKNVAALKKYLDSRDETN